MKNSYSPLKRPPVLTALLTALFLSAACSTSKTAESAEGDDDSRQTTTRGQTAESAESDKTAEAAPEEDAAPSTKKPAGEHAHDGPRGHHFEHPERYADRWNDPERDAWQKPAEVIEMLGVGPKHIVADLGTGTGYFLPHLSEAVGPQGVVYGLDISENMLDYTRKQVEERELENVQVRQVSADSPRVDEATYHRLLTVNTWHHIRDRVAYAQKLYEVIRPGGAVLIVDYTMEADQGPPKRMRLAPEQVVRELEKGGFDAEHIAEESLPKQYVVKGYKREPKGD